MADRDHYPTYYPLATACAALSAISRSKRPDRVTHYCATEEEFERLPGEPAAPSVVDKTVSGGRYQRLKTTTIRGVVVLLRYERAATEADFQRGLQRAAQDTVKRLDGEPATSIPVEQIQRGKFIF